ncbi:hypothetical protein FACS1894132_13750 [Clostridia bacterium]|nr:hypothetical protein FACS1894132_13750 [Clostridia bacterium]
MPSKVIPIKEELNNIIEHLESEKLTALFYYAEFLLSQQSDLEYLQSMPKIWESIRTDFDNSDTVWFSEMEFFKNVQA